MEAAQPLTTYVSAAMTEGAARALVRLHRRGSKILEAAAAGCEHTLAEATGVFIIAFSAYRAKAGSPARRNVTLMLTTEQHAALGEVKRCSASLTELLNSRRSARALSVAHFELVRALDIWQTVVTLTPPEFRGVELEFD